MGLLRFMDLENFVGSVTFSSTSFLGLSLPKRLALCLFELLLPQTRSNTTCGHPTISWNRLPYMRSSQVDLEICAGQQRQDNRRRTTHLQNPHDKVHALLERETHTVVYVFTKLGLGNRIEPTLLMNIEAKSLERSAQYDCMITENPQLSSTKPLPTL